MNWTEVAITLITGVCVVSFFMGKWPWEGAIVIHKRCDCKRKRRNEEG